MFTRKKTENRPTLGLLALGVSLFLHLALLLVVTGVELPLPHNTLMPVFGGETSVDVSVESVRMNPGF